MTTSAEPLRPVVRPGEDWNQAQDNTISAEMDVAPGREAGRGLERRGNGEARRHGHVAPGREAGRGLEQLVGRVGNAGVKLRPVVRPGEDWNNRAFPAMAVMELLRPVVRPGEDWNHGSHCQGILSAGVAPGREAGRGLEPAYRAQDAREGALRPVVRPGEDWNQLGRLKVTEAGHVAPGREAGRGLEPGEQLVGRGWWGGGSEAIGGAEANAEYVSVTAAKAAISGPPLVPRRMSARRPPGVPGLVGTVCGANFDVRAKQPTGLALRDPSTEKRGAGLYFSAGGRVRAGIGIRRGWPDKYLVRDKRIGEKGSA